MGNTSSAEVQAAVEQATTEDSGMWKSVVECPICVERMHPPVYQCRNGHIICKSCHGAPSMRACAQCRVKLDKANPIRNLAIDDVLCRLFPKCSYGCGYIAPTVEQVLEHEPHCLLRPVHCPYCSCKRSTPAELISHLVDQHGVNDVFDTLPEEGCTWSYRNNEEIIRWRDQQFFVSITLDDAFKVEKFAALQHTDVLPTVSLTVDSNGVKCSYEGPVQKNAGNLALRKPLLWVADATTVLTADSSEEDRVPLTITVQTNGD
eukprot:TRINITY_DN67610_c13_g1_i1.p1 TRINITY_DN67610_c13_g1~~TRINITY_DN67610_c13_g1_i1.p1  ORF type:complete len:262 (+),score=5.60 TRINITY_DN67610_c13_g1_i1:48-833(+)